VNSTAIFQSCERHQRQIKLTLVKGKYQKDSLAKHNLIQSH
jgi:hypothetical protein